jgi:hypothetical protein
MSISWVLLVEVLPQQVFARREGDLAGTAPTGGSELTD